MVTDVDGQEFLLFIKKCFAMKRKTLWNNIKQEMDEIVFKRWLDQVGLVQQVRPENVSFEQFIILFKEWKKQ